VKKNLLWIGMGAMALGIVLALFLRKSAEDAATRVQFEGAAMGYQWDYEPDYTGMWVGVIIAALGAIAVIAHLSNSRANQK